MWKAPRRYLKIIYYCTSKLAFYEGEQKHTPTNAHISKRFMKGIIDFQSRIRGREEIKILHMHNYWKNQFRKYEYRWYTHAFTAWMPRPYWNNCVLINIFRLCIQNARPLLPEYTARSITANCIAPSPIHSQFNYP